MCWLIEQISCFVTGFWADDSHYGLSFTTCNLCKIHQTLSHFISTGTQAIQVYAKLYLWQYVRIIIDLVYCIVQSLNSLNARS